MDVDLLMPAEDIESLVNALNAAKYHIVQNRPAEPGHFRPPMLFVEGAEACVEIRCDLGPGIDLLRPGEVLKAATEVVPGLLLPTLRHRILHNVIHGQIEKRDRILGRLDLRDVLDLARLIEGCGPEFDWQSLAREARARGLFPALSGAIHCAHRVLRSPLPAPFAQHTGGRIHGWRCVQQRRLAQFGGVASERGPYGKPAAALISTKRRIWRAATALRRSAEATFEMDHKAVQQIVPPNGAERFEGIGFSSSGNTMAIATSESKNILLFRRRPDGRFEDVPFQTIGEPRRGLDYPHDVSFARSGNTELLAVAQRNGAIAIYQRNGAQENFGLQPAFEIIGPQSKLLFSDGVAFVPPANDYLAACNLDLGTVVFFRRISLSPLAFEVSPEFELKHPSIADPDGLAFSRCGRWLATANHAGPSVSIFQRRKTRASGGKPMYGPEPVSIIEDPGFCFPHSLAFTPKTNHLVVSNAGANYFSVYAPRADRVGVQWSQSPVSQVIAHEDDAFQEVNMRNKMEGGPKGVAIHGNHLAVCSPQIGVKIYSFREKSGWLRSLRETLLPPTKWHHTRLERAVGTR